MINIPWLHSKFDDFPPTDNALDSPNGLLAAGGDLSTNRLISAYSRGIFPWFSEEEPILWWTPSPRCVVFPDQAHCSKSLAKLLRKSVYRVSFNEAFEQVIHLCGDTRKHFEGTWITEDLEAAYCQLHDLGYAHSVEVWKGDELVGGLYGVAINRVFFGESMFSLEANTSKIAFVKLAEILVEKDYLLIDCQVTSQHLRSLGAVEIPREEFEQILQKNKRFSTSPKPGSLN
ncbi:leucyl/phenylalanyl-tRNA--protein transferase [Sessilibacter corallicola]|uniref:Leucyl/phenylalanyl-tRNA--protein transferase n=1 Tax=Sessilibacter corallicola TaxID=2904075 RepID=A0ABQ0A9A4_9GAMM|nr:leucyl/phenylalanyl-tRNA--protein transferase [Sessilibacter corallicola]MCE2030261.1 leucyl/phenylalanyl-tRNA--protein transferase [Sessilibacter corallicola]